jgi:toxin-antitoxin system PIN domain toxin
LVALPDVNVLVALFDEVHIHYEAAHQWLGHHRHLGWATCPLTENGFVRIISSPTYSGRGTNLLDAIARLEEFRASGDHSFWPDSVSLRDGDLFRPRHITGHRQLTDVYLLALAVQHSYRLATFDRTIPLNSMSGAKPEHLALLET